MRKISTISVSSEMRLEMTHRFSERARMLVGVVHLQRITVMSNVKERRRVDVFDIKGLRKVLQVYVMNRIRNRDIRGKGTGVVLERADQSILKWYAHIDKMYDGKLTKEINRTEVDRDRG